MKDWQPVKGTALRAVAVDNHNDTHKWVNVYYDDGMLPDTMRREVALSLGLTIITKDEWNCVPDKPSAGRLVEKWPQWKKDTPITAIPKEDR